ncbi:MAG TPA: hypothetical protein VNO31_11250 [Umezawaea sp.]|nr:hypothetical protein [Umezawaea sp.]
MRDAGAAGGVRGRVAGEPTNTVVRGHRVRLERLFTALRDGVGTAP